MKEELVSIIIPAYNVEEYLEECVKSLLSQTYKNYEIIIIDDGSTDQTYKVARNLSSDNKRIKLLHQRNQGVSVARNIAMKNAEGEYFIFVDADDVVAPRYVETLVTNLKTVDMVIVGFSSERKDIITESASKPIYAKAVNVKEDILCGTNYDGYLWNKIFRRSIIEKYKLEFRRNIVVWEDLLFVLEYLNKCKMILIFDDKLYFYRKREGSAVNSTSIEKYKSKYVTVEYIKNNELANTIESKKRISLLYFETMFSFLNKCLSNGDCTSELVEILSKVNGRELLKNRSLKLFFKYLYLRITIK